MRNNPRRIRERNNLERFKWKLPLLYGLAKRRICCTPPTPTPGNRTVLTVFDLTQ